MTKWEIVKNNRGRSADSDHRVTVSFRKAQRNQLVLAVNLPKPVLASLKGWENIEQTKNVTVAFNGRDSIRLWPTQPDDESWWAMQLRKKNAPNIVVVSLPHLAHTATPRPAEAVNFNFASGWDVGSATSASFQHITLTLPTWAWSVSAEEEAHLMLQSGKARGAKDLMEEFGWTQAKALEVVQDWRKNEAYPQK